MTTLVQHQEKAAELMNFFPTQLVGISNLIQFEYLGVTDFFDLCVFELALENKFNKKHVRCIHRGGPCYEVIIS